MDKKPVASIIFAVFGLAVILFVSYKAFRESERNRKIEQEIAAVQAEAEKIQKDNRELEEKIAYFRTPEFQEKIAKEKLNFQKADEEVVIIKSSPSLRVEAEEEVQSIPSDQESLGEKEPNYRKWWRYFFNY